MFSDSLFAMFPFLHIRIPVLSEKHIDNIILVCYNSVMRAFRKMSVKIAAEDARYMNLCAEGTEMENRTIAEKKTPNRLKRFFRRLFDIRDDMMSYEEIDQMMQENTVIHGANMWILMLAILIASIGLNVNSTAVIIGAMLISPLMSGIMTMGYSLAVRDLSLLRHALARFGTQVAISLIASTIYFFFSPLNEPTAEMIARTSPTIWDVLIALFGGIAGMIGNTRKKKGNVIPGVAIATALMPPLCTVGYGIATLQPKFIFGAFYLFLINTLFIILATAFVTLVLRVPYHKNISEKGQKKINRIIAVITIVAIIPSVFIGAVTVYKSYIDQSVSSYLQNEFSFPDTKVVQSNADIQTREISVSLVGAHISDEAITILESELSKYHLEDFKLHITQNFIPDSTETENTDKITIAIQENKIAEMQSELDEKQTKIDELEKTSKEYKSKLDNEIDCTALAEKAARIFTKLNNCSCGVMSDKDGKYILLYSQSVETVSDSERETIANWLKTETGMEKASVYIMSASSPDNDNAEDGE